MRRTGLVGDDVASKRKTPLLDDLVDGVFFHAGHEEDTLFRPLGEEAVVIVSPIHGHDGVRGQTQSSLDVVFLGRREADEGGHVVVVVQEDVRLDASLCLTEFRPREKRRTQRDGRGVEGEQLVLEAELLLASSKRSLLSETRFRADQKRSS